MNVFSSRFCLTSNQMAEINDKNTKIGQMAEQMETSARSKKQDADKSVRDVEVLRKQLREEKKMKKAAIHKVDDLLSQVSDPTIREPLQTLGNN
ncbi:unnamed protein product [Protopolystoma xenopodis]|uniref:Uncharacterized protein n=1 Tax=Protopolystoma xenopodis TaxID=117903 RepID=A0A3S4ZND3_9PLAT|nr:unnamed protein product [Protopolystoma xenopodis]